MVREVEGPWHKRARGLNVNHPFFLLPLGTEEVRATSAMGCGGGRGGGEKREERERSPIPPPPSPFVEPTRGDGAAEADSGEHEKERRPSGWLGRGVVAVERRWLPLPKL